MSSKLLRLGKLYRTHYLRDLNHTTLNQKIKVAGFITRIRENSFFDIKDTESGQDYTLQILVNENLEDAKNSLTIDSSISIEGQLVERPVKDQNFQSKIMKNNKKTVNNLQSFELDPTRILNLSTTDKNQHRNKLNSKDWANSSSAYKLENRFLSLRTDDVQSTLKFRSRTLHKFRSILHDKYDFAEVETPTLFSPSPGGAREFIVPSSYYSDQFYSLVQSPQQFKQILMIGGIERYFQIAKCYRDEKLRDDRQPEFTQLDLEMSYVTREEIMALIEDILDFTLSEDFGSSFKGPYQVLTFDQCMETYGIDKPDVRFGFTIEKETTTAATTENLYFIEVSDLEISRKKLKALISLAEKEHPKNTRTTFKDSKIYSGDLELLGRIRKSFKPYLTAEQFDESKFAPLWVIDFPLLELKDLGDTHRAASDLQADSQFQTVHHPFTSPSDTGAEAEYGLSSKSLAYDLVLNGHEVGGGSIRVHDHQLQEKLFKILDINKNGELDHILRSLSAGAPPHGGIALGLDRLMAVLLKKETLEEVIAFPKSAGGRCYLSGAPVSVSEDVKRTYHLVE